jgi:hypothetical protein
MNFEDALDAMRTGGALAKRKHWSKEDCLSVIEVLIMGKSPDRTHIELEGRDIMATDWELVEND